LATATITVQGMVEDGIPIAAAIKAELARRNSNFGRWAIATGHSRSAISRLLNGENVQYPDIRESLCRTFGLDRDWLDEQLG